MVPICVGDVVFRALLLAKAVAMLLDNQINLSRLEANEIDLEAEIN